MLALGGDSGSDQGGTTLTRMADDLSELREITRLLHQASALYEGRVAARDELIRRLWRDRGDKQATLGQISQAVGLSKQRVHQIAHGSNEDLDTP